MLVLEQKNQYFPYPLWKYYFVRVQADTENHYILVGIIALPSILFICSL